MLHVLISMNKPALAILLTLLVSHSFCALATSLPSVTAAAAITGAPATTTTTAKATLGSVAAPIAAPVAPTSTVLPKVNSQSTIASVIIPPPATISITSPTSLPAAPVAATPVAPVAAAAPSSTAGLVLVGGLTDVSFDLKCLAKILESGLFKLTQITSNAKPVGFSTLKSQVTAGTTYQFDYAGTGYVARIRGTCQAWSNTISLDEASYTKI